MTLVLEFVRAEEGGDPHAFRTGVQEYLLRWPGGSYDAITIRWDDALSADLAALRDPLRAREAAQKLGDWLQQLLAPTRWREHAAAITCTEEHVPIDIEIRSAAAELYALPWELLTLPGSGEHLAGLRGLRLRYRQPAARPVDRAPSGRREGGRILLASSSAFGPVGEARFADAIAGAARAGGVAFDPVADVLPDVSLARLIAALEQACAAATPPAILQILCHGVALGGAFALGLGTAGAPDVVDAARARLLAPFARHIRLVVLTACDGASVGAPGSHLGGVAQALHAVGFEALVAARAPIAGRAALDFSERFYTELIGNLSTVDDAFVAARRHLRIAVSGTDWAQLQLHAHAAGARPLVFRPYRGLLAFEPAHARLYFGRAAECAEAVADLEALIAAGRPRLLVVAGASGSGKSSVVLAGVVPRLAERGVPAVVMRPGRDPQRALDEALTARPGPGRFLLVVDQFEELFTHAEVTGPSGHDPGDSGLDGPRAFARRLWQLAGDPVGEAAVVLTLRVDYLGRCGDLVLDDSGVRLDRIAYDEAHRVFVAQMTRDRLRETIDGPAARLGLALETGLRERLLQEIGDEPSALPLLQYALDELWARRDGDTLTHAALDALGGAVGALARRADAVLDDMSEEERAAARRLLVRAASYAESPATGTRRQRVEAEVRPQGPAGADAWDRAIRALVDARLVVRRARDDGDVLLDISHEALIRNWPRLWSWYQEDRTRLAEQTQLHEWVEEWRRFPDNLLTGNKLGFALRLRELQGDELSHAARALIDRSEAAERRRSDDERERARTEIATARRRTRVTLAASVVLLAALVFSGLQWRAATLAEDEARLASAASERSAALARENLVRSDARRLAALAGAARERGDLARALRLAVAAAHVEDRLGADLQIAEVSQELRALLAGVVQHQALPDRDERGFALAWSPDGTRLARALWNRASVTTIGSDEAPREFPPDLPPDRSERVAHLAWTPDGRRLFMAFHSGDAELWDVDRGTLEWSRRCGAYLLRDRPAAMSPDGARVAVFDPQGFELHIVSTVDGQDTASLPLPGDDPTLAVEWGASGALLAFGRHIAQVWPQGPASAPVTLDGIDGDLITDATFSPDGTRLAVVTDHKTLVVPLAPRGDPASPALPGGNWARFAAHGARLLIAGGASATLWSPGSEPDLRVLPGKFALRDADFAPDGRWLVTTDMAGAVHLWDLLDARAPPVPIVTLAQDIEHLAFDPAGERIAASGESGWLWPYPFRRDPIAISARSTGPQSAGEPGVVGPEGHLAVAWRDGGAEIVALGADGHLERHSVAGTPIERRPLPVTPAEVALPVISPDGHVLAYINISTGESVLVDLDAAAPRSAPASGHGSPNDDPAPAWSADGTHVVFARDPTSLLVRRRDGGAAGVLPGLPARATALAISPAGDRIAAVAGPLLWWSLDRPDVAHTLDAAPGAVRRLEFDAGGERLLALGDGQAAVLALADGRPPVVLGGALLGRVSWAAFRPGADQVAVAGVGRALALHPLDGGPPVDTGFAGTIRDGGFSPDGTRLLTVTSDGALTLHRFDHPGEPAALVAPAAVGPRTFAWSPDGRHVLSLDHPEAAADWSGESRQGGTAHVHVATTAGLVRRACSLARRGLDDAEWRQYLPEHEFRDTCPK